MKKLLGAIILVTSVILIGGKIYTDVIVQRAEAKYPPANFVTVGNLKLHYVAAGLGQPVVIIPGGSGKVQDFSLSPLYELAVDEYRVIIFDRPGLGYSDKPLEEATPAVQARLIHAAIDKLGSRKPVLVGQSWGGIIALAYAQAYPDEVSGIILLGSAPYPQERQTNIFYAFAQTPLIGDLIIHTLYVPIGRHWIAPTTLEQNREDFAPLDTIPETYYDSTIELGLRPSHLKASAEETRIIPASLATVVADLDKLNVPVIILNGDKDTHAIEQASRLQADLPVSKVIIVEGAAHYLWFGNPEAVMRAIRELCEWSIEFEISR